MCAYIPYSQVTPKSVYLNRRRFLGLGAAAFASIIHPSPTFAENKINGVIKTPYNVGDEKITSRQIITGYNNFYEFGTDKGQPAVLAKNFRVSPWSVTLDGEVARSKTLGLDTVLKLASLEERIYR